MYFFNRISDRIRLLIICTFPLSLFVTVKQVQVRKILIKKIVSIFLTLAYQSLMPTYSPGIPEGCYLPPWSSEERRSCWTWWSILSLWQWLYWTSWSVQLKIIIFMPTVTMMILDLVIPNILAIVNIVSVIWGLAIMPSLGLFFIIPCMDTIQVVDLRYCQWWF